MGLFGVVSGSVARRRGELAVRLALGATYGSVVTLVMKDGARRILLGVMLALPGIYFTGRAIRGVLIGVPTFDVLTNVAVAAGLALVALCACYLAARGVRSIEPARMLHDQG
jgi:putative ABC transport system permease protein